MAEYGRLRDIDGVAKRFAEFSMVHRGELKAIVTTVIPLPPSEEKELKESLHEILAEENKVKLEQKVYELEATMMGICKQAIQSIELAVWIGFFERKLVIQISFSPCFDVPVSS
ncbi:hypothetical protein BVRB_3g055400 [Beta vulgaris subsp. vulgaris]|nr:hypothetical protein BVRB_3g055400 [Beta vulgaris subsp. vulgaris]